MDDQPSAMRLINTKWSVWLIMLPAVLLLVLILVFQFGYGGQPGRLATQAPSPSVKVKD